MENMLNHPLVEFYIQSNKFGELLGMDFEIESPGEISYYMDVTPDHLATPLAAHGGSISALMDATMGVCALSTVLKDHKVVSTVEFKISFVSPAQLGDRLKGQGKLVKGGRRILFVEGEIRNQNNDLIAFATGTFNAYPAEKAGFSI
jgi:uncharacterized protein (TIGR00369 family)